MESKFTTDVFISYAHIDDATFIKGDDGWVTSFHTALQTRLGQVLGEQVNIWRDNEQLQGNDMFADKIINQFEHTAIMVSVITPRYVKSEWCNREVDEFIRIANTNHSIRIKDKLRIFKVLKTPVPLELQPAAIRDTLGYEFYTKNHVTKLETELSLESETRNQYKAVLERLAWDIKGVLEQLRKLEAERIRLENRTPEEIAAEKAEAEQKKEEARLAEEARKAEEERLANKVRLAEEKKRIKKEEEERKKEEERIKIQKENDRIRKEEVARKKEEERLKALKIDLDSKPENAVYSAVKYSIGVLLFIAGLFYLFGRDSKPAPEPKPEPLVRTIPAWTILIKAADKNRINNATTLIENIHNNLKPNTVNYEDNEALKNRISRPRMVLNSSDFPNYTSVRSTTVNNIGISYSKPVSCTILKKGNIYYFERTKSILQKSGQFYYKDKTSYVYLGGTGIGSGPLQEYNTPSGEAGLLFQNEPNKLLLLIPKESSYTLLEFEKE